MLPSVVTVYITCWFYAWFIAWAEIIDGLVGVLSFAYFHTSFAVYLRLKALEYQCQIMEAMGLPMLLYHVEKKQFYSREHGWTDRANATRYTMAQTRKRLPNAGSYWVPDDGLGIECSQCGNTMDLGEEKETVIQVDGSWIHRCEACDSRNQEVED